MVERTATVVVNDDKTVTVQWTGIEDGDTGEPVRVARYPDKTIQVTGTFGNSSIALQGSNLLTPGSWGALSNQISEVLALTDLVPEVVGESPLWIRPVESGGDATTDLTCTIICTARGV